MAQEMIVKMAAVAAVQARIPRLAMVTRWSFALVVDKRLRFRGNPMQLLNRERH